MKDVGAVQKRFKTFLTGSLLLLLAAGNDAKAQTASPPVLTIDEAVAAAMKSNRREAAFAVNR